MSKGRKIFANLFGAQFLVNMKLSRNLPFITYCFIWLIFIIFMEYSIREILIKQVRNDEEIKTLRSEYVSLEAEYLFLTQKGEITRMLKERKSLLMPPSEPPIVIKSK